MRPWAPLTPAQWTEDRRPRTDKELARETYWLEYGRARDHGFPPESASAIASAEVKLVLRRSGVRSVHTAPTARRDSRVPVGGEIVYDPTRDVYARIGDSDDTTPLATAYDPAREAEHKRFSEAEADFAADVEAETGNSVSPEEWMRQRLDRAEIRRQSHSMANKLECAGTPAYRTDEYQLYIWHVMSKEAEGLPNFRRICFLPYIAAIVRASKLAALEYFLERHPFCRFWTFTSGKRVAIPDLRGRVESLHERLNALNKELRRRFGVELVFRSTELGTVETVETAGAARKKRAALSAHKAAVKEAKRLGKPAPVWTRAKDAQHVQDAGSIERDENGEPMFHPHAHCVFYSRAGFLKEERWAEIIAFVWRHWGDHWDAGKVVGDAREVCKYVTKPGDMDALTPSQLAGVEKALHGLRLVTPLGVLKAEIAARKKAGKTLRRKRTPEGMVWRESYDHNKQLSQSEEDKDRVFALKQREVCDRIDAKAMGWAGSGTVKPKFSGTLCRVVSRLAPAAGPTPIKEPRVVVMATRGGFNASAVMSHPLTVKLWNQGIHAWEAGRAISVHTGTPTGETRPLTLLADTDERFAPATEPVWEASTPAFPVGMN